MTIRTGSHYRGQSSHRTTTRLSEQVAINRDGSLAPASTVLSEAVPVMSGSAMVPSFRKEDFGWSYINQRNFYRDLPPAQQEKMIALSFWLYRNNAMAKRVIGMLVDFIWGDGLAINSTNTKVKDTLDGYWKHPRNNWPLHGPQRLRDLLIYGEWLHRPRVSNNGFVYIDSIQPDKIGWILPSDISHEELRTIVLKAIILPVSETLPLGLTAASPTVTNDGLYWTIREYPVEIIHYLYDDDGKPTDMVGDVFFFGLNRTTDTTRGVGELFPLIDYIDLYDDVLFNRAERIATSAAMWWDLLYEGQTAQQIQASIKDETQLPPKPGSVFAHNEKTVLTQKTPEMHADDHSEDVAVLRSHIIASAGFTGTMFDAPGDAGRAVGAEMAESVYKSMKTLQEQINQIIRVELDYVLFQAMKAGKLAQSDIDEGYVITFPQPSSRDIARTGPAMFRLSQALAGFAPYITPQEARSVIVTQINKLGLVDQPLNADDFKPERVAPVVASKVRPSDGPQSSSTQPKETSPQGTGPTPPATAPSKSPA